MSTHRTPGTPVPAPYGPVAAASPGRMPAPARPASRAARHTSALPGGAPRPEGAGDEL
ncbi:hypothetical protein [Streptomyces sp. NPDC001292]|uniref:hypothetical protein n=1 Tax=Streptomyces sp. NPDC001292 TaxID=3364558 RepID=UPI0036923C52